jgi:zinc transporter, ZIP family
MEGIPWTVFGLAALPALGNIGGGLLAELLPLSQKRLSLALHAAAGVVLAVVAIELVPKAMQVATPWITVAAFVCGGLFFVLAEHAVEKWQQRTAGAGTAAWLIFFGVAIDLFSDGVMIGAGSTVSTELALLLALGQVPADVPEGFAAVANLRAKGTARSTRLLLSLSFTIPLMAGATLGYFAVRDQPEILKLALLSFTAGVLTTVVVEEIVPEAHREGEARFAALAFVGGFAVFALLSAYLG